MYIKQNKNNTNTIQIQIQYNTNTNTNTIQYNTIQYNTIQYNTIQHNHNNDNNTEEPSWVTDSYIEMKLKEYESREVLRTQKQEKRKRKAQKWVNSFEQNSTKKQHSGDGKSNKNSEDDDEYIVNWIDPSISQEEAQFRKKLERYTAGLDSEDELSQSDESDEDEDVSHLLKIL